MITTSFTVTYRPAFKTDKFVIAIIVWRDGDMVEDSRSWRNTFTDALAYVKQEIENLQSLYDHTPARVGFVINPNELMSIPDGVTVRVVTDVWDDAEMAFVRLWLG